MDLAWACWGQRCSGDLPTYSGIQRAFQDDWFDLLALDVVNLTQLRAIGRSGFGAHAFDRINLKSIILCQILEGVARTPEEAPWRLLELVDRYQATAEVLEECGWVLGSLRPQRYWGITPCSHLRDVTVAGSEGPHHPQRAAPSPLGKKRQTVERLQPFSAPM